MTDDTPPFTLQRATLEEFWDDLKWALDWIFAACGAPAEIAARKLLSAHKRQDILIWLAPIEALARRILLLAALKEPANPHAAIKRSAPIRSAMHDAPLREPSDNPADWRVLFSDWPRSSAPTGAAVDRKPASASASAPHNAYPLARRVEALCRLARDPSAAIKRMAKKIALRRGQLCFAFGHYRHPGGPVHTLLSEVQTHVDAALWNTS